ncbi:propionate/acetate kinase [Catenovulum agarivorans DS-2]|uniref:Acetate kinase n=1 Tax=Catenovulum agarivorans DS-2 TaxID=1328313 RepID=W7QCP1_9ALTE|nr:acetate kinase [Catenovulum agarivorans]EWH10659.1 propionate/acetate kinase [Catenovulum agarivorans DS-2]
MHIDGHLVVNAGSSSIKFSFFDFHSPTPILTGLAECLFSAQISCVVKYQHQKHSLRIKGEDHKAVLLALFDFLSEQLPDLNIAAVGHRVVHGGEHFSTPVLVNEQVIEKIASCNNLAPLHNPANLIAIKLIQQMQPNLPQVVVFDTAFHQSISAEKYLYALPYNYYQDLQVRKYGFHGTSHQYVSQQAVAQLNLAQKDHGLIVAHLGNGASVCAVFNGKSVETSMGLTPLDGLMMGTRCGDLDPGVFNYLCDKLNLSPTELTNILNKKSGLLGISQLSNDMRTLLEHAEQGHEGAILAIDMFCYRLAKHICASTAALPKLDAIVFTGGIGEHAAAIRSKTIAHLKVLHCVLDEQKNLQSYDEFNPIHHNSSLVQLAVIATNEEWMIAQSVSQLVKTAAEDTL